MKVARSEPAIADLVAIHDYSGAADRRPTSWIRPTLRARPRRCGRKVR
jgi:hypothetical protein